MDTAYNRESLNASDKKTNVDLAAGMRELADATAACCRTAAQARKTLSGMEPEMRGLRLMASNDVL